MKRLKKIFLLVLMTIFSACGTGKTEEVNEDRFDMWEYMTATVNYEVEYALYENGSKTDYFYETHKMMSQHYERENSNGITTLDLNKRDILMKEPSRDVKIERYAHLGDNNLFHAEEIKNCQLEHFFKIFENKGMRYNNVLMVDCISQSGIEEKFYYGYNEGLVTLYKNDHGSKKEWVKISEKSIP